MIAYDLRCAAGHVFEAWFARSADYDDQCARGLVVCPLCGSAEIAKAAMAPAVQAKGNRLPAPAEVKAMLGKLARAQRQMLAGSEYVGERFAHEARAMHEGEGTRERSTERRRAATSKRWSRTEFRWRRCPCRWCRRVRRIDAWVCLARRRLLIGSAWLRSSGG